MAPEVLAEMALKAVQTLWPGVELRQIRSRCRDQHMVFARWFFAYLLYEEAGLWRGVVADLVNWRNADSVTNALGGLRDETDTNRLKAQELDQAVKEFRALVERRRQ